MTNLTIFNSDLTKDGAIKPEILSKIMDDSITNLAFLGCSSLVALPDNLPAGLTSLNLINCSRLTALPDNLPAGLTSLILTNCSSITALPDNLPAGLTYLNLFGCSNLTKTTQLVDKLQALKTKGCTVTCPAGFNLDNGAKVEKVTPTFTVNKPLAILKGAAVGFGIASLVAVACIFALPTAGLSLIIAGSIAAGVIIAGSVAGSALGAKAADYVTEKANKPNPKVNNPNATFVGESYVWSKWVDLVTNRPAKESGVGI